MTDEAKTNTTEDREWLLVELANREVGAAVGCLGANEEATIRSLQADLETIADELRRPEPEDCFSAEHGCRLAIERVERIVDKPEFSGSDLNTNDLYLRTIGPYQVEARIGQGGMGAVYRAFHAKLQRVVAIKVLPTNRWTDEKAIARFEREMAAIGALHHPNIVGAHDAGASDGMHYLVMEYIDGVDLSTLISRVGPLAYADACEIVRQAALGLQKAWSHKIVHRDIKPSNLMLAAADHDPQQATVKVLDFGLARLAPLHAEIDELTYSGQIMGTLKYMAPEQCSRSSEVDIRADIYALGATFYKLLCGNAPFSESKFESPLALLAAVGSVDPQPLARLCPDIPAQLVAIVGRMMAKNPDDRFSNPHEVIDAITPWARGSKLAELLERARVASGREESIHVRPPRNLKSNEAAAAAAVSNLPITQSSLAIILLAVASLLVAIAVAVWMTMSSARLTHGERLVTSDVAMGDPFQRARGTAKWIQSRGGAMEIAFDDTGSRAIGPDDDLPKQNFHLNSASLAGSESVAGSDLARFSDLPFFYSLMLNNTPVSDADLRELGRLPLLKCLYLSETSVTDAALADLKRYPQLTHIHLHGTPITDAGLVHLGEFKNLTQLYLVGCRVSDRGLTHLTDLKKLGTLWLEDTDVTAAGIARLKRALPDCFISSSLSEREIGAAIAEEKQASSSSASGVDDDSPKRARDVAEWLVSQRAEFGITTAGRGFVRVQPGEKLPEDFIQLNNANLDGNKALSNKDLARFDKLPLFTTLGLSRTSIGDDGLRNLGDLPLLKELFLSETIVADAGLEEFRRFPKLEVLHLYGTQVTDAGLVHLAGNSLLVDLSLVGCSITDDGLKHLIGLKRLKILALDRTGVTVLGVAKAQIALPECEIRSDYNSDEIAEVLKTIQKNQNNFEDQ